MVGVELDVVDGRGGRFRVVAVGEERVLRGWGGVLGFEVGGGGGEADGLLGVVGGFGGLGVGKVGGEGGVVGGGEGCGGRGRGGEAVELGGEVAVLLLEGGEG